MSKWKVIGLRFLKTFISGFIATASAATALAGVSTWATLGSALNNLAIAGIVGGISAVLMAGDKLVRWEN